LRCNFSVFIKTSIPENPKSEFYATPEFFNELQAFMTIWRLLIDGNSRKWDMSILFQDTEEKGDSSKKSPVFNRIVFLIQSDNSAFATENCRNECILHF